MGSLLLFDDDAPAMMGGLGDMGSMLPSVIQSPDAHANFDLEEYYQLFVESSSSAIRWTHDSTGKILPAPHNMMYSQRNVETKNWGGTNLTIDPTLYLDPQGLMQARKVLLMGGHQKKYLEQTTLLITGATYCFSVYAQKVDIPGDSGVYRFAIEIDDDARKSGIVFFDITYEKGLVSNTVSTLPLLIGAVEDVNERWWRLSVIFVATENSATTRLIFEPRTNADVLTSVVGASHSTIWGASLTESSYLMPFVASVSGLDAFQVPRIDHAPHHGGARGLLIEKATTNYCADSEDMNKNTVWLSTRVNVAASIQTIKAISGTAQGLTETSARGTHSVSHLMAFTPAAGSLTLSVRAKAGVRTWLRLEIIQSSTVLYANYDLTNKVVGNKSASTTAVIHDAGDGFSDCRFTITAGNIDTLFNVYHVTSDTTTVQSYSGNTSGVAYHIAAIQIEEGGIATSYVPTFGVVRTRDADELHINRQISLGSGAIELAYARNTEASSSAPLLYLGKSPTPSLLYTNGAHQMSSNDGTYTLVSMDADNDDLEDVISYALHYHGNMMDHIEAGSIVATSAFDGAFVGNTNDGLGLGHGGGITRITKLNIWDSAPGASLLEGITDTNYTLEHNFRTQAIAPSWLYTDATSPGFVFQPSGDYGAVAHNLFDRTKIPYTGSWVASRLITASGAGDLDGGNKALTVKNTSTGLGVAGKLYYPTIPRLDGGRLAFSVYAKVISGEHIALQIENREASGVYRTKYFNRSGAVSEHDNWSALTEASSGVIDIGSGWARYWVIWNVPPATLYTLVIFPAVQSSDGSLRARNPIPSTGTVLYKPQAEITDVLRSWIGFDNGKNVFVAPRVDWNPGRMPSGGALLCQGMRENVSYLSERPKATGTKWAVVNGTLRENSYNIRGISLHGITEDRTNALHKLEIKPTLPSKQKWAASCVVRQEPSSRQYLHLSFKDGTQVSSVVLNGSKNTYTSVGTAVVESWATVPRPVWHVALTIDNTSVASSAPVFTASASSSSTLGTFVGNNRTNCYLGGFQIEKNLATNYIPTYTANARSYVDEAHVADIADYISPDAGTIIGWVSFRELLTGVFQTLWQLKKSNGKLIELNFRTTAFGFSIIVSGSRIWRNYLTPSTAVAVDTTYKVAVAWADADWRLVVDDEDIHITSGSVPDGLRDFSIGQVNDKLPLLGSFSRIRLFDRRLTKAEILAVV